MARLEDCRSINHFLSMVNLGVPRNSSHMLDMRWNASWAIENKDPQLKTSNFIESQCSVLTQRSNVGVLEIGAGVGGSWDFYVADGNVGLTVAVCSNLDREETDFEDNDEVIAEYIRDFEYEQSDDALNVDETAEKHLKGIEKRAVDIDDVKDLPIFESDSDYIPRDSSESDVDDRTEHGEGSKFHKPRKWTKKTKLPQLTEFKADVDIEKPVFKLGLVFSSGAVFKQAVREYAIMNGKDISFKKNDPHRVRVVCRGVNYPWVCFASKIDDSQTFVIKTYINEHKCSRNNTNRFATSKWLSKKYLDEFKSNENWRLSAFIQKVSKYHVLEVSKHKAYKAKRLATKTIEGTYEEQYTALYDYAEEIKYTNKGSTVEFLTDMAPNGKPRFKRMYICYAGLKNGFSEGCRPVIGLDGCHIKGPHQGQLLTAIGIDANNGMYPIAFAVVEIENKDSWSWFMNLLKEDCKILNSNHWTFITDKQKGLEQALKGMWEEGVPEAEHRHCARHLEKNFSKVYKEKTLKDLIWKAARQVTITGFHAVMEEIKNENEQAYEWLLEKGPIHWSRSHFRTHPQCDILLNNLCESFNGLKAILAARDRPILSMLERIRMYLMQRLTTKRHSVVMWHSNIAPKIVEIL
ncbi:uncharacterized protein LOC133815269 [Humulus lupulus]|uniref:uncharacterized protein LOC133815269 n=1 Tax=Humulus lupulus TaxID=3486 RepID=UPI002B401C28|nr:uncharacterized protein LOC133815269 [Humulus lupulus]